jgi:divinyl protochlorophyllide a 8-vinyl-reductase
MTTASLAGGSGGSGHRLPGHAAPAGRIGPNALIQPLGVLRERFGEARLAQIVRASTGLAPDALPLGAMVDERLVARLHQGIVDALGEPVALGVLEEAGRRTGDYLLAHRIPRPAQAVLKRLPARLSVALLARAMAKHAWTFAGTGTFTYRGGRRPVFELAGCPLCRGMTSERSVCRFYAGTFARLVRALAAPHALVDETSCHAAGDDACRFTVTLHPPG